jgi:hypothetical protein
MKKVAMIFFLAMLVSSGVAQSAAITCSGVITQVNFHASDSMMIKLNGMNYPVHFCRPSAVWQPAGVWYSTPPEMCRAMIAMFTAGMLSGRSIAVMYFDGDAVPSSCSSFAPWSSVSVRYFEWGS